MFRQRLKAVVHPRPAEGGGPAMAGINNQDSAVLIGPDLGLERVAVVFAPVAALWALMEGRARSRVLEAVNDRALARVRGPCGFAALPCLVRLPLLSREE